METLRTFGRLADGRTVRAAALAWPGGLQVEVLDYGAIVRRLRTPTPGGPLDVVLGFDTIEDYERDRAYQGCVVGRFANRLARGRFVIDGRAHQVSINEAPNCLHGGRLGFSKRLWRFDRIEPRSAALAYHSPAGEEGFPGAVEASVEFSLTDPETLEIRWEATTDGPTPISLTHHLYFNLAGDPARVAASGHELAVAARNYTPVHADLIPTGELACVAGTPFDFRTARPIAAALAQDHPQLAIGGGLDHNWALDPDARPAVALRAPETGLRLEMMTDQPGVQIYSGQGLETPFRRYGGVAVEPQGFPDAPNHPGFPPAVLRPGQAYRRFARYRLVGPPA